MRKKFRVGVLGATGMVGQHFVSLLESHPWFDIICVAASLRSQGKTYADAVKDRWALEATIPQSVAELRLFAVEKDIKKIARLVDFVFCALDADKEIIRKIEEQYAAAGVPVISNNSAHRWSPDVPMIIPEVNPHHTSLIRHQQKVRKWNKGFIVVKPNCSIQSYVGVLTALQAYKPQKARVVSLQAISGAGKTFDTWPEMVDNVIPFIQGEEEKSEKEPQKIWGVINDNGIQIAQLPTISATCIRVPVSNGHMATVSVTFEQKLSKENLIHTLSKFDPLKEYTLPSAPVQFITYFSEDDRPQTKLDRDTDHGMGITVGRLREDILFDWKFVTLSHNILRGAAGGAVLVAELLVSQGYIQ